MNPKITPARMLVLFLCLLAISMATRVNDARGASAAADPTLQDTRVMRFITSASSATLTNPTVSTTFDQGFSFPANMANMTAGGAFEVTAHGKYTAAVPGSLGLVLHLTNTERITATIVVPTAVTDGVWTFSSQCNLRTAGGSGTFVGRVECLAATNGVSVSAFAARSAGALSISTLVANDCRVGAFFGVSNAGNTITLEQMAVETLR